MPVDRKRQGTELAVENGKTSKIDRHESNSSAAILTTTMSVTPLGVGHVCLLVGDGLTPSRTSKTTITNETV